MKRIFRHFICGKSSEEDNLLPRENYAEIMQNALEGNLCDAIENYRLSNYELVNKLADNFNTLIGIDDIVPITDVDTYIDCLYWRINAIYACSLYHTGKYKMAADKFAKMYSYCLLSEGDNIDVYYRLFELAAYEYLCLKLSKSKKSKILEAVEKVEEAIKKLPPEAQILSQLKFADINYEFLIIGGNAENPYNKMHKVLDAAISIANNFCPLAQLQENHPKIAEALAKLEYRFVTINFIENYSHNALMENFHAYCLSASELSGNPLYPYMLSYISFSNAKYDKAQEEYRQVTKRYNDLKSQIDDYHLTTENYRFINELVPNLINALPLGDKADGFSFKPLQNFSVYSFHEARESLSIESFCKWHDIDKCAASATKREFSLILDQGSDDPQYDVEFKALGENDGTEWV